MTALSGVPVPRGLVGCALGQISHRGTEGREARGQPGNLREQETRLSVPVRQSSVCGRHVIVCSKESGNWVLGLKSLPVFWIVGRMEPKEEIVSVAMAQALEEVRKQRGRAAAAGRPRQDASHQPQPGLTSLPPLGSRGRTQV